MLKKLLGINDNESKKTNDLTNVADVRKNILYTKDGYSFGFLRLYPINIDLLSNREIESKYNVLTASFKSENQPFTILSIPRTVDLEKYLDYLNEKYENEITNLKRRMILGYMINSATDKIMSDTNYEHQFYIKIWEKTDEKSDQKIAERLQDFESRYNTIQNKTQRLNDIDIIKLCNLYANSNTASMESYDENTQYTPIPKIKINGGKNGKEERDNS